MPAMFLVFHLLSFVAAFPHLIETLKLHHENPPALPRLNPYAQATPQTMLPCHQLIQTSSPACSSPGNVYSVLRLSLKSPGGPPGNLGKNLPTRLWYSAYSGYFLVEINSVSQVEP